MPTLNIELPEAAYRAAIAFMPVERTQLVTATFLAAEAVLPGDDEDPPLNQYHLDALREAIAEEEAGQTLDGDAFMAELREKRRGAKPVLSTDSDTKKI